MSWTPERKELAAKLWQDGLSATQIANRLACGISRNAVIGVLHRMGKATRASASRSSAPKRAAALFNPKQPAKPRVFIAGKNQVRIAKEAQPPKVEIKVAAFAPIPGSSPRPWMERTLAMCCWPVGGEGESTLYCCEPVHKRGWCAHHHGRGTVPLPAKASTPREMYRALRRHVA